MAIITDTSRISEMLRTPTTVAVLGAHTNPSKAAYYVPHYLNRQGFRIYPVNPNFAGETLFDAVVVSKLAELKVAIDIVNVFRRSEAVPEHLDDILAMSPRPQLVWLQLGIRHDETAQALSDAGIDVIQDRCMLADHQYLL